MFQFLVELFIFWMTRDFSFPNPLVERFVADPTDTLNLPTPADEFWRKFFFAQPPTGLGLELFSKPPVLGFVGVALLGQLLGPFRAGACYIAPELTANSRTMNADISGYLGLIEPFV